MDLSLLQAVLSVLSGSVVGFALGLIGGGGSILAVPLLLYVVGLPSAHLAIGTSALTVAVNAFANLAQHARNRTVKWPCAAVFAVAGVLGALVGSTLGKAVQGDWLLLLFAVVMIAVGMAMLLRRGGEAYPALCRTVPAAGSDPRARQTAVAQAGRMVSDTAMQGWLHGPIGANFRASAWVQPVMADNDATRIPPATRHAMV